MSVDTFRFPRRRSLLLFCLATVFLLGAVIGQASLTGFVASSAFALVVAAIGASEWMYSVRVTDAEIDAGSFMRRQYALSSIKAISVRRTKGGRTGAVELQGGRTLWLDGGIARFDELLQAISSRTSLPITKPIWDP
ncbi:hypothetical protein [Dyella japonica]|uniref:PH domain-containing protein n=1 Tax=Dyella japonica A8 TaxID=1217721 RepID=A0A075K446_9GAMM|nr:hypothetical protein [Dyella japonica]AIF46943.1 hypothetical protein HY57_06515 [Dyella japonica A8]